MPGQAPHLRVLQHPREAAARLKCVGPCWSIRKAKRKGGRVTDPNRPFQQPSRNSAKFAHHKASLGSYSGKAGGVRLGVGGGGGSYENVESGQITWLQPSTSQQVVNGTPQNRGFPSGFPLKLPNKKIPSKKGNRTVMFVGCMCDAS